MTFEVRGLRRALSCAAALLPVLSNLWALPAADDSVFQAGEELTYNVSFGPLNIGQVRIALLKKELADRESVYTATAHIDSYKGVPFVNLHAVYDDHIAEGIYSTWFRSRRKDEGVWVTHEYVYDYPNHRVSIKQGVAGSERVVRRDTLRLDTLFQDGLSLLFLARKNLMTDRTMVIPTLVNEKKGKTIIRFSRERAKEQIDAVNYPIDLIHFEGDADFVGIFGLTGAFEGWFSNDAARVPVVAKMKVLIGNIRIELMKWKRVGWAPPRFPEGAH